MLDSFLPSPISLPLELFAQAGGGGSFGGGSSGGGGGEGSGEAIYWLIQFTIHYPQYGVPLCIVVVMLLYYGKKAERSSRMTRTIRRGRKVQEQQRLDAAISRIRQRDPEFELETFQQRVANGFVTIQYAWSEQNLSPCRAFISDGIRERFELYIAMQQAEDIRNRMKDVVVRDSEIVSVNSDLHFDTIHVRFTAAAISYNESLSTGKRVSGHSDQSAITFAEIWSFSRRPGVTTNPNASLMQGRCPNCGGPVEIVDRARCPQCQSIVNSGEYDWVLAEITQDEEWVLPAEHHRVQGWNQLQQDDPGLNFQHLEDRTSVIFWRSLMAVYFRDFSYAAPVMDRQADRVPELWDLAGDGFWKTPAVGVVEVVQCVPAGVDEFDRIMVLVRWSATRATGDRQNPTLHGIQNIYAHVLILKRRRGVHSNLEQTFSSFSCSGCGAPLEVGTAATCQYCGADVNDGKTDWILEDVGPHNQMELNHTEDQSQSPANATETVEGRESGRLTNASELLTALARLITVDGELHEKEQKHMIAMAKTRGVSKERLQSVMATATSRKIPLSLPRNRQQANVFMDHLLRAALVDGQVTRSERELLLKAGEQMGWTRADLKMALARIRGELYQQARRILRDRK